MYKLAGMWSRSRDSLESYQRLVSVSGYFMSLVETFCAAYNVEIAHVTMTTPT